jgi:hypothetical protein
MRIETALSRRDSAVTRLRDMFSSAKYGGMTATDMDSRKREIAATTLKGCPSWVKTYLDGYEKALRDALYADSLMFGGYYKGVFYSTHSDRADYYGKNGIDPVDYANDGNVTGRGHYWKTTKTPKPYFVGETEESK